MVIWEVKYCLKRLQTLIVSPQVLKLEQNQSWCQLKTELIHEEGLGDFFFCNKCSHCDDIKTFSQQLLTYLFHLIKTRSKPSKHDVFLELERCV